MPNMPTRVFYITILALWILLTIGALAYFAEARLVEFDPQGQLGMASVSNEFDQHVGNSFSVYSKSLRSSVFHIQQKNCSCNTSNLTHVARINAKVREHGFNSYKLDANDPVLQSIILPSTPAIVVFDHDGKLAYMGPYSSGLFCGSGAGIVDGFINMVINNTHLGTTIVSDSQGCYCHT